VPDLPSKESATIVELIPALRAFARTLCRNANDADDLVQATLVKALNAIDSFEPGTRMKSWLFTIMRNTFYTSMNVYRRETPGLADCASAQRAVEATQEWSVRGREVREALDKLAPDQREVIILITVMGTSYEDAAKICGCAMGTIKSRLNRARENILKLLGEESSKSLIESPRRYTASRFEADAGRGSASHSFRN
jgi:RNA polymerase sigma-70 factor (ECF subfamily)